MPAAAAAVAASILLSGCTLAASRASGPSVEVWAAEEPASFDPFASGSSSVSGIMHLVYSGLVKRDASGTPLPDLAAQVPDISNGGLSPDGRTVTYRLREGLVFSDGTPLTSADAVATFRFVRARVRAGTSRQSWLSIVDDIQAPRPDIVQVRLRRPAAWAPSAMLPFVLPASRLVGDPLNLPLWRAPMGSGPYTLASWQPRREMVFERNRRYHGERPLVSTLRLRFPLKRDLSAELLKTSAPVVWEWLPDEAHRTLSQQRSRTLRRGWMDFYEGYVLSSASPVFSDPRLRESFAKAFPHRAIDAINDRYVGPLPKGVTPRPIRPDSWAYQADSAAAREDTRAAARLLRAAGFRGHDKQGFLVRSGKRLVTHVALALPVGTGAERIKIIMNALRQVYGSLGWQIQFVSVPDDLYGAGYGVGGSLASGGYDAALAMLPSSADPLADWPFRRADEPGLGNVFGENVARAADARLVALADAAEEPAPIATRRARIDALIRYLERVPYVIVQRPGEKLDAVNRVEGVVPSDGPWGDFWNVEQWRVTP